MTQEQQHARYQELIALFQDIHHLKSTASLLEWDQEVMMPEGGRAQRAEETATLEKVIHERLTSPQIGDLLEALSSDAENPDLFDDGQRADIREAAKSYDKATKLPTALVQELARLTVTGPQAWIAANKANDYSLFAPTFSQIIERKKEYADALRGERSRYDALLDEYEPAEQQRNLRVLFAELREALVPLLQKIKDASIKTDPAVLCGDFPFDQQRAFSEVVIRQMGFNFDEGRLDVSTHPFCAGQGGDVRITTRYNTESMMESLLGCVHETGHALYEQGMARARRHHPSGGHSSLGIHESQSRLWENIVARSQPFWEHFYPKLQKAFPSPFSALDAETFWRQINHVQPSFIRTESDEVTYNLHIILRFELEDALIEGKCSVADLPEVWNDHFKRDFGLEPQTLKQGFLQDIHWPMGLFGYFPTYALGNLYASQFFEAAKRDLGDLHAQFAKGEFDALRGWLKEKIHEPAGIYPARELCQRVTQQPLSIQPFLNYLNDKYARVYGF